LIDLRRDPTPEDRRMIDWLEAVGLPYIFAVTKIDKVSRGDRTQRLRVLKSAFGLPDMDSLVPVSAHTGEGIDDLLHVIREALTGKSAHGPSAEAP
jgi:GTP-binding protein